MNEPRLPNFAIVGAQKSASTFIQDALRAHRDVYMPSGETRFFEDPEYGEGNINELSSLFSGRQEPLLGIKRPDYLGREEVPARMRRAIPAIKIIVVLRNPIDRLVSAYYYYIKLGILPVLDINEVIPRMLRGETIGGPKARDLLGYGNYATHLRRYFSCFPREQILILLQEDIAAGPRQVVLNTCKFLGADADALGVCPAAANEGVYSLTRLRFLTKRNRYLYDYDEVSGKLSKQKMTVGKLLPAATITVIDRYLLARTVGNRKPILRDPVKTMLADFYRDEIKGAQQILGRSLQGWSA
jgi:hypothetical protein